MLIAVGLKEKAFGRDVRSGRALLHISKEEHSNKSMWFVPQGSLARSGTECGERKGQGREALTPRPALFQARFKNFILKSVFIT